MTTEGRKNSVETTNAHGVTTACYGGWDAASGGRLLRSLWMQTRGTLKLPNDYIRKLER